MILFPLYVSFEKYVDSIIFSFFQQVFLTYWCLERFNLFLDRLTSAAVVIQRGT